MQQIPLSEYRREVARIGDIQKTVTVTTAGTTALTAISPVLDPVADLGKMIVNADIVGGQTIVAIAAGGASATLSAAATGSGSATAIVLPKAGFQTLTVHLFTGFAGGLDPVPADFAEATFDTYAAEVLTATFGPHTTPTGQAELDYNTVSWVLGSTPVTGNSIVGYWLDYIDPASGSPTVALWETFSAPQPMTTAGNGIILAVPIQLPTPGAAALL